MQITPILICLVVISIVEAALVIRIPKPKLNSLLSQKLERPEIPNLKSPEERRKFSLFPKSYMKYVISPYPINKITTPKPIVHGTKKPLMKKLNQLDKKNKVENETEQPTAIAEAMYENKLAVTPKLYSAEASEEASVEVVEENSKESNEKHSDAGEEEDKPHNYSHEIETAVVPPTEKPVEVIPENKSVELFADVSAVYKNSKENETPDSKEFIFVDPAHKLTESEKTSSEESEECVTTEFYEELEIFRRKRGSNVIEEENLASTVPGYKYTWKDTTLDNDVAFKNIHS